MIKLSDFVMDFINKEGVNHVFMLSGGGCMHLVDSIGRNSNIEHICNLHEQAASIAAEAYGQYTNNIGVALVTTGPGGTNAITGIAGAWIDSTPCLIISGQVKRADLIGKRGVRQMGVQEVDIISIVKPITKYAVTVLEPATIRYHMEKAVHIARSGRPGPVWIDIPLDVQSSMVDENEMASYDPLESSENREVKSTVLDLVRKTIELLNNSERPVILIGNGVRLAKAENYLYELIEFLQLPVLTTWKAIDLLDDSHPLFAGRPGMIGQRGANFTQQNSDWLMALGARLDLGQIGFNHAHFAREAKKIVVDIDSNEIEKIQTPIDITVVEDARLFLIEFLSQKYLVNKRDRSAWWKRIKEWKAKYPVLLPEYSSQKTPVNPYHFIDVISQMSLHEDVLVSGSSGTLTEIFMQAFRVKFGQRIIFTPGLGAMGFGLPAGIGACIASGKRRTICINGDGGFQLNIQELETVRRLNLPIKFFIINNGGYASIIATQRNFFDCRYFGSKCGKGFSLPDILELAKAYNIKASRITDHDELPVKIKKALEDPDPFICEVVASQEQLISPRVKSFMNSDGTMVSMPMEDLWPFLEREEFFFSMIIPPTEESRNLFTH